MLKLKRNSYLGYLNYYLLQFFFIRLAKHSEKRVEECYLQGVDFGLYGLSLRGAGRNTKYKWFSIMTFVMPLTGWSTDYKFLGELKYFRITPKKVIK